MIRCSGKLDWSSVRSIPYCVVGFIYLSRQQWRCRLHFVGGLHSRQWHAHSAMPTYRRTQPKYWKTRNYGSEFPSKKGIFVPFVKIKWTSKW